MQIGLAIAVGAGGGPGEPTLSSPSFALQNTAMTNDMGPDGYSWPQAGRRGPILKDAFGCLICLSENSGGSHTITYSNDSGATWADGPTIDFITRGSADYNTIDDKLEVLWLAQAATDGILYRRYAPTRDGSNHITAWTAQGAGYTILDNETTGTMEYQHPCISWHSDLGTHGTIVCAWGARNTGTGGTGNEIRAVRRALTNTAADLTASNWVHLGVNSTTTIGNAPGAGSYTAILANVTTGVPHPALIRLASGDLFCAYHDGTVTSGKMAGACAYKTLAWTGTDWTPLSSATTITNLVRAGTNTGSSQLGELLSKPVEVTSGVVALGIATWKDNTSGDTWGYAAITVGSSVTLVDVYSAAGAHSYAPAGDVDAGSERIIVSYIKTTTQAAYARVYHGTTTDQDEVPMFSSAPVDIPLIRVDALSGKLCVLFRDTNATHKGWFGTLNWG